MAILAPTGVAAINAGGQTIHSFFGLAPSLYVPNDKRFSDFIKADDVEKASVLDHYTFSGEKAKIMKALDMIIIDEVSMVRADLMDAAKLGNIDEIENTTNFIITHLDKSKYCYNFAV